MSNGDKVSPRQIQLIQGAAAILVDHLYLSKEEAIEIISDSLREELRESKVLFEFLEIGTISYRQTFIRNLVHRVEVKIIANKNVPQSRIKEGISIFVKMLYASWGSLGSE
jgi:urease gamma subunit